MPNNSDIDMADYNEQTADDLVQLARLSLSGRNQDVQLFVRRLIKRYRMAVPKLSDQLATLLRDVPSGQSPLRSETINAVPVDIDTRLQLVRPEYPVNLDIDPVWTEPVRRKLEQIVFERHHQTELYGVGLHPTRTALFTGPPGVGKTLAARWIANKLGLPLVVLELSAVMSSFLGRTGSNIRNIFDYAKGANCVLLLDELDAVAKRRDDAVEIGELKRLVTVLLQSIDDWPASGILLAATNHPDLLDPAVWRRFEAVVDFPKPDRAELEKAVNLFVGSPGQLELSMLRALSIVFEGASYNDVELDLLSARREAVVNQLPLSQTLGRIVQERVGKLSRSQRSQVALALMESGYSQRQAHTLTGVSRDTMRRATQREQELEV